MIKITIKIRNRLGTLDKVIMTLRKRLIYYKEVIFKDMGNNNAIIFIHLQDTYEKKIEQICNQLEKIIEVNEITSEITTTEDIISEDTLYHFLNKEKNTDIIQDNDLTTIQKQRYEESKHTQKLVSKIHTKKAPQPVGPYSQALLFNNMLYLSGQIAINPKTNKLIHSTNTIDQFEQIIANISAILNKAQSSIGKVIKVEIFLQDLNDFQDLNKKYSEIFTFEPQPVRTTVEVSKLPLGAKIEICITAYI